MTNQHVHISWHICLGFSKLKPIMLLLVQRFHFDRYILLRGKYGRTAIFAKSFSFGSTHHLPQSGPNMIWDCGCIVCCTMANSTLIGTYCCPCGWKLPKNWHVHNIFLWGSCTHPYSPIVAKYDTKSETMIYHTMPHFTRIVKWGWKLQIWLNL